MEALFDGSLGTGTLLLLVLSLVIAFGFEFVNGFHDTANAVATVIYTRSLRPWTAVILSGICNFLGVFVGGIAVALSIINLLPVELLVANGTGAGLAMLLALLLAAITWNLGTWYFGLPSSSSHTLIGAIVGVGLANSMLPGHEFGAGVNWAKAGDVGLALLISPLVGFTLAALLLLAARKLIRDPQLYRPPVGTRPPPPWIRTVLIGTCTGVSFAHGSNDGQKGMGLIMLILIGVLPTAYALNRAMPDSAIPPFLSASTQVAGVLDQRAGGVAAADPRAEVAGFLRSRTLTPAVVPSLASLVRGIEAQVRESGSLRQVPAAVVQNTRNDMYMVAEALRHLNRAVFSPDDAALLQRYRGDLDTATRFIPTWVKLAVAIALGLGTMVGWKRIVVTVGEKIGKQHLTYAQGASAELVAAVTIAAADVYGLPVSTTHVLSSGVAGTMAANRSGLQMSTVRNLALAWVLTLPAAILLAGSLFWLFVQIS